MSFEKKLCEIQSDNTTVYYHHYLKKNKNKKRILLLHGSRLGGEETWHPVITRLKNWSEIIVPEIRGAGALSPICKRAGEFTIEDLVGDTISLINTHNWQDFYLVGYSFGGYISMLIKQKLQERIIKHILIESALLADTDEEIEILASALEKIANLMETNPEEGNALFTDLVEPRARRFSSMQTQTASHKRAIYNPLGFATLMKILVASYRQDNRWEIISKQSNTVSLLTEYAGEGVRSMASMIKNRCPNIQIEPVPGTGHGMLFSQPWLASDLIDKFLLYT